ncbi:MAG: hypothetical protein HY644_03440 [Acidobacteria bacterium]|nr:hypothetical protein [Acidobacteriota bacterium]
MKCMGRINHRDEVTSKIGRVHTPGHQPLKSGGYAPVDCSLAWIAIVIRTNNPSHTARVDAGVDEVYVASMRPQHRWGDRECEHEHNCHDVPTQI